MRTMEIPCFPRKVEINNLEHLYKTRLKQKPELQAAISIPLLGYMGWPNDPAAREHAMQMIRTWLDGEEPREFLRQIPLMHQNWGRVADVVQLHHGLGEGGHQQRRGGASVGKAIFLGSERIKARGASQANMWEGWSNYKDSAHLIAAVIAICADMQRRNRKQPLGIGFQALLPIRVVCLVPELVIGVGLHYQEYGLNCASVDGTEPMFDAETLWRIPEKLGIECVLPLDPVIFMGLPTNLHAVWDTGIIAPAVKRGMNATMPCTL
ncbi:MAG: hypothetical protein WBG18_07755 [Xanthobacteraceae bacterium]|jgi:hypothetical protein